MGNKLTLEEQETIILYDNKNKEAEVYTHHKTLIKKLDRLCTSHPEIFQLKAENDSGGKTYKLPKRYVKINAPRKSNT